MRVSANPAGSEGAECDVGAYNLAWLAQYPRSGISRLTVGKQRVVEGTHCGARAACENGWPPR
jgi:hypothetical protein